MPSPASSCSSSGWSSSSWSSSCWRSSCTGPEADYSTSSSDTSSWTSALPDRQRHVSRFGLGPGPRRCRWSWAVTAVTWTGPGGWACAGARSPSARRSPLARAEAAPADRPLGIRGSGRSHGGDRAPAGRFRTGRPDPRRLASDPQPPPGHSDAHARRPGRAGTDRPGHLDHGPVRNGRCGDPGRDRRPDPLRDRPRPGQARGPAPREKISGTCTGRTKLTGQGSPACASSHGGRSGEPSAPTPSARPATST